MLRSTAVLFLVLSCSLVRPGSAALKLNEIYFGPEDLVTANSDQGDGRQFVEIRSTTGGVESLNDVWLLEIEGDYDGPGNLQDDPGVVLNAINLGNAPNPSTGNNGLFLLRDNATVLDTDVAAGVQGPAADTSVFVLDNQPGRVDFGWEGPTGTEFQNQIVTFLLVEGFTGSEGDDLDNNVLGGDGTLDVQPWTNVLDALSIKETGDPGFQYAESLDPGGTLGFVDFVGGTFGADLFSFDTVRDEWAFYDSGSGENMPSYVGPFFANDGFWFFGTNDAGYENGDPIHVAPDTEYLWATPGVDNLSAIGGLLRGDVDHDGDVDADDIDFLYDNLGNERTDFNVDLDFAFPTNPSDLDDVVALVEGDTGNGSEDLLNTAFGDADLDQDVDLADLLAAQRGFGADVGWAGGDFDGSNLVDGADLATLEGSYGFGELALSAVRSVPEPEAMSTTLIILGALAAFRRR